MATTQPTQVARPWRATVRTIFQGIVAFAVLLPILVKETGLDPQVYPWLGGMLAVAGIITRLMALPQVEAFLRRFLPFLAADPSDPGERGAVTLPRLLPHRGASRDRALPGKARIRARRMV